MERTPEIDALHHKLKRELRYRFVVWPILMLFFGVMACLALVRTKYLIVQVLEMELISGASPEFIKLSAIQESISITLGYMIFTVNLFAFVYCLIQLIKPRAEAKIVIAMIQQIDEDRQQ
ncbi:hypothetical protein P3T73_13785 [Kiritimatiellota bacterium B12222]|nr:hypothetical protein P3T73_13785 [Kiritimatiellota bacterium B12222]